MSDSRLRCDQTPAWKALLGHFQKTHDFDVRDAMRTSPERVSLFGVMAPHVYADLSKNLLGAEAQDLLLQLAAQTEVLKHRDAMFAGETVNKTENRAALHALLRWPLGRQLDLPAELVGKHVLLHNALNDMLSLAESWRADPQVTDVVNIGIGGSDLGPAMVVQALEGWAVSHSAEDTAVPRLHFVSNVDGMELGCLLRRLKPANTRFVIASKTFTTAETMVNAKAAKAWFEAACQRQKLDLTVSEAFVALTASVSAAKAFGITKCLAFWDWVGGRFSLWSSIGLSIAVAVGAKGFKQLLQGAHEMDEHFRCAPLKDNLPVRLALLDVWYRNFYGFGSRCIAPYSHNLRRLPAYLQQLEMESNGKGVDERGNVLPYATSPVIWGEPGTNGQHAFFEMIHQGRDVIPVEFIALREPGPLLPEHHTSLLTNALAQARALMMGVAHEDPHKACPGNRPSTFLMLDRLDPASLGALIALYEHRTFVSASLWGINPFDQWGVELGKNIAKDLLPRLESGVTEGLDASTEDLIRRLRQPVTAEV